MISTILFVFFIVIIIPIGVYVYKNLIKDLFDKN